MFARLMNSCKPEHELQNVQPQIKGISKAIDTFHKDLLGTVREIGRWQVHQEPPIQNFLSLMAQFEEEIAAASVEYTDGYAKFAEFWEAVLEEHKSLQDTEKQHDKAMKNVEKHLGKKIKAETVDEPSETRVSDETAALSDAQMHEQELRARLHTKMLAYEKNLHKNLRMAYYILHCARLDYYHKCEDISQRAIGAIDSLQDVNDLKETEFTYQPFNEPVSEMAKPYWGYEQPAKVRGGDLIGMAGASSLAGQSAATPGTMDVNSPQFASVSSAVPMGLAMSNVSQQPPLQHQDSSRLGGVSQTPDVGLFPLSASDQISSQPMQSQPMQSQPQMSSSDTSFWEGGNKSASSDIQPAPVSNFGSSNLDNAQYSSSLPSSNLTSSSYDQPLSSSYDKPSSSFDQPSSTIGSSDQFGSSSSTTIPSTTLHVTDMSPSRDLSAGSSSGIGGGSSSIDTSSVFKPSEVSASYGSGLSSPSHKQSTFLNAPSYMNPPSSSLNPDYSAKQQVDIGTPSSSTDKVANRPTDVGIGSSSERMF